MVKKKKNRCGKVAVKARKKEILGESIRYHCLECGVGEDIPKSVIELLDIFEEGDMTDLPEFKCKKCKGIMEPMEKEEFEDVIYITHEKMKDLDEDEWF